jgi:hypothetical protein
MYILIQNETYIKVQYYDGKNENLLLINSFWVVKLCAITVLRTGKSKTDANSFFVNIVKCCNYYYICSLKGHKVF